MFRCCKFPTAGKPVTGVKLKIGIFMFLHFILVKNLKGIFTLPPFLKKIIQGLEYQLVRNHQEAKLINCLLTHPWRLNETNVSCYIPWFLRVTWYNFSFTYLWISGVRMRQLFLVLFLASWGLNNTIIPLHIPGSSGVLMW